MGLPTRQDGVENRDKVYYRDFRETGPLHTYIHLFHKAG